MHAKNYATLLNTSVGTKEMVHRIFKSIIPRTNLKNVRLDLLKHYTTLFVMRHLLDGGIDLRFSTLNRSFLDMPKHLQRLMSDWFIAKDIVDKKDVSKGKYNIKSLIEIKDLLILSLKVYSPDERISNITLKKSVLRRDLQLFLSLNINAELKLAYEDLGNSFVTSNCTLSFFEYASFNFEENNDTTFYCLHIGTLYRSVSEMKMISRL